MDSHVRTHPLLRRSTWGGLLLLLAVPLASGPAIAQEPARDVTAAVDELFQWATDATPGCAVAVSEDGVRVVDRAYGSADLGAEVPLTPETRFDAGSVVKQVVAAAVLLLVEDGRIALDDDVRLYVPELPDPGHVVTVDHLLTHTGGVRDWTALRRMASDDADALTLVLRQRGLTFAPGDEWAYSNSGYVLLKELVARVAGAPFSEVVQRRLFDPLGMASTVYADDPQRGHDRLAVAYQGEGNTWEPGVLAGNERGGGGALLTTAGDLLTWTEALGDGRLGTFVTETIQAPARLNSGREIGYARGLFLDVIGGARAVWHSGSAGAYKALAARFPEHGLALAVLCNAGDGMEPMRFAGPIRQLFLPDIDDAPTETASAAGVDVESRAGLFFGEESAEPLRLVAQGGRLRVAGGPALVPVAEGRFRNAEGALPFWSEDRVEIRFVSPDAFELVTSAGDVVRYRRPEPEAHSAAELAAFAGRYESDELRAVLEVAAGADGLTVRLNGSRPFDFVPVARDVFHLGPMTGRFRRDEAGRVVALDYSSPVLRDVRFVRQADASHP